LSTWWQPRRWVDEACLNDHSFIPCSTSFILSMTSMLLMSYLKLIILYMIPWCSSLLSSCSSCGWMSCIENDEKPMPSSFFHLFIFPLPIPPILSSNDHPRPVNIINWRHRSSFIMITTSTSRMRYEKKLIIPKWILSSIFNWTIINTIILLTSSCLDHHDDMTTTSNAWMRHHFHLIII